MRCSRNLILVSINVSMVILVSLLIVSLKIKEPLDEVK